MRIFPLTSTNQNKCHDKTFFHHVLCFERFVLWICSVWMPNTCENILLDAAGSLQFCHLVGIATHSRTCLYMHPLEQTWTCKWLIGIGCRSNTMSIFSIRCNERARHKRGSEHFNFRADKLLLHERCIGTPIATSPNQNPAKNSAQQRPLLHNWRMHVWVSPCWVPRRNPQANFGLWGNWSELWIKSETRVFKLCSLGMWTCQTCWSVYSLYVHSWIRLFNILCWNQLDVNFNAPWFWCKSGIGSAPLVVAPERSPKGEHGRLVDLFLVIQTMKVLHDITMLYLFVNDCT